ncbi:protein kinase [Actinomadura barringtoniae]|uniref:non-specific serine/threonine protein kinase n=1 Tax=Actinomadura barringtoniae TaxID=1427535 RepID=A0A939PIX7_9ACTN|nr:serine/threonine-protein kinase [Actinomadura barringtoniae]MBO2449401.1 protein kinase [Actinomadura barringtoniae]
METPPAAGRYRIDRMLGTGGFATVWLGHDDELDSPVAIKILADHWAQRSDVRERFVQEARLLRQVDSHQLVQVFDIGELDDGRPYFVMSYADRGTLEERLAAGPLPLSEALGAAQAIARGVQALHSRDIVHRDLKPSNVLIRSTAGGERFMISDLGIARTGDRISSLTMPAGSPGYMAPEQAQIDGAPDARADVFGLGALTYHMLTGEPPGTPARPPSELQNTVPHTIDAVVLRALDQDRERRWPTASEFAGALSQTLGRTDTDPVFPPAKPTVSDQKASGKRRRKVWLYAGAGVAVLALAGGGTAMALQGGDDGANGIPANGDPHGRLLRTNTDIPKKYRSLIIEAGSWCDQKGMSPALIAAMLKAESGFNPTLADPQKDEYGIARWTPKILVFWQPGGLNNPEPTPAQITPELSIPAMGRYMCYWGKDLKGVPGDPALNLAATYRSSSKKVVQAHGVPAKWKAYTDKVHQYIEDYQP